MRRERLGPDWLTATLPALTAAAPLAAQAPDGGGRGTGVHESARHGFRVVTFAEGLDHPRSMAWLPNGDLLIT